VVTFPGGATARDAEIMVEQFDTNYDFWIPTGDWTRSGSNGAYSVDLDENGTYRVTARPPWGVAGQYSATTSVVTITGCPGSCVARTVNLTLASPNVTLTVMDPTGPGVVADSWLHIEEREGDGRWVWTNNGGNTNRQGRVAFNLEPGEYRIWVNAPWNRSDLARFTVTISVSSSPIDQQLRFPTPNFTVTVRDPNNQTVPNVWAYAERFSGDFYQWADVYGNGNQAGVLSMSLAQDGQYRVVVEPPPGRADLSRFTVDVTVSGGNVTPPVTTINFPTSNVTGSARIGSASGTVARFGWVEFRQNGAYISGVPVRENGTFAATMPSGVYEVFVYPDWSQSEYPPIHLDVTVSGSNPLQWRYHGDPSDTTGPLDVYFGRMDNNVVVEVTSSATTVGSGIFVTFKNRATNQTHSFVTDVQGRVEGVVPVGSYDISAVKVSGSSVWVGSITNRGVVTPAAPTVNTPDTFSIVLTLRP